MWTVVVLFALAGAVGTKTAVVHCRNDRCLERVEAAAARNPLTARVEIFPPKGYGPLSSGMTVFPPERGYWRS